MLGDLLHPVEASTKDDQGGHVDVCHLRGGHYDEHTNETWWNDKENTSKRIEREAETFGLFIVFVFVHAKLYKGGKFHEQGYTVGYIEHFHKAVRQKKEPQSYKGESKR